MQEAPRILHIFVSLQEWFALDYYPQNIQSSVKRNGKLSTKKGQVLFEQKEHIPVK
jgi:hypothetical protein